MGVAIEGDWNESARSWTEALEEPSDAFPQKTAIYWETGHRTYASFLSALQPRWSWWALDNALARPRGALVPAGGWGSRWERRERPDGLLNVVQVERRPRFVFAGNGTSPYGKEHLCEDESAQSKPGVVAQGLSKHEEGASKSMATFADAIKSDPKEVATLSATEKVMSILSNYIK